MSAVPEMPRIPLPAGETCANFAHPASTAPQPRGRTASSAAQRHRYTVSGTSDGPQLRCLACNEFISRQEQHRHRRGDRPDLALSPAPPAAPYDPANAVKIMEIYRVYYNYVKVCDDRKTPAMRLGLAKGPCSVEDIVYHVP